MTCFTLSRIVHSNYCKLLNLHKHTPKIFIKIQTMLVYVRAWPSVGYEAWAWARFLKPKHSSSSGLSLFKLHSIYPVSLSSSRVTWLVCSTSWMLVVGVWGARTINKTNKYEVINFKHWNNVPVMITIYNYIKDWLYWLKKQCFLLTSQTKFIQS